MTSKLFISALGTSFKLSFLKLFSNFFTNIFSHLIISSKVFPIGNFHSDYHLLAVKPGAAWDF